MADSRQAYVWGTLSGAEGVVVSLHRAGVSRVFGIPAAEDTPLFAAFVDGPVDIVLSTSELGAVFMADAHARATGQLSACLLAPGPGLTNALSGIAEARLDSSPLLVLVAGGTGDRKEELSKADSLAEKCFDPVESAIPMCKRTFRLRAAEEVPPVLAQAIRLAREGEPGPVLVEIPLTAQHQQAHLEGTGFRTVPRALSPESVGQLEQIVSWIGQAEGVALHAGAGCFGALTELEELAERLSAPVSTTISGLGALPYIHPLCVGFGPGAAGSPVAEDTFSRCDMVLAIGCKTCSLSPEMLGTEVGARVAVIDIEPVAGSSPRLLRVRAPAKQALRYILDRVAENPDPAVREVIRQGKRRIRRSLAERPNWSDAVDPIKFFVQLRELLSADDYLILDAGRHAVFAIAAYPVHAARTLLAPVDFRASGFSVPAAVAVKLARPENRVVACVGDGGFLRTGVELLTARRCDAAPVVVVFADRDLGVEEENQKTMLSRATSVNLMPVDYESLARSLGVGYLCIRNDEELEDGLTRAVTLDHPVVVELRVAYREASTSLKVSHREDLKGAARSSALLTGARWIMRKFLKVE